MTNSLLLNMAIEIVDLGVLGYTIQSFGMMYDYNIYMYLL
jgi:hypothetical protein